MRRDDPRSNEVRPWFTKSTHDLRAAEVLLAADPPLLGEAAYHCQQATEKALKGFRSWHDVPFGKTHDLAALGGLCVARDSSIEPLCMKADRLSVFAWAFRYPGDPEEPEVAEVVEAIDIARSVLEAMLARLPTVVHPTEPREGDRSG
jgi:HEPN domain-containing protein